MWPNRRIAAARWTARVTLSRLGRLVHRWGGILIAAPLLVVVATGLLLQLKKESDWVQPPTRRGTAAEPRLAFERVLAIVRDVPQAAVEGWDDIDRLDVRPSKGMLKVRCRNRWEVQLDAATGEVLQIAYRRSDVIESLHDGSWFHEAARLGVFLPAAVVLLVLWATGLYLFVMPRSRRRANRRRRRAGRDDAGRR